MISNTLLNLTTRLNETLCNEAGIWIPFIDESQIPLAVRAFLYLMGLLVVFFGIALASDLLMCSIGRITTQTIIRRNSTGNLVEEHLWNPTVANLTLLALGTSAPEILLSTIEVTSKRTSLLNI